MKGFKRILRRYILSLTVISCAGIFLCGVIVASERTAYNAHQSEAGEIFLDNKQDYFRIVAGGKEFKIKKISLQQDGISSFEKAYKFVVNNIW